jgi:hypothetical protein
MGLEMKTACMKCDGALAAASEAYICSHECTFCAPCSTEMQHCCPNCGGELLRRPRRIARGP